MEAEYLTNFIPNMIAPNIVHFTNYQLNKKTKNADTSIYRYICNRPTLADNIGKPTYRLGPK